MNKKESQLNERVNWSRMLQIKIQRCEMEKRDTQFNSNREPEHSLRGKIQRIRDDRNVGATNEYI